MPDISKAIRFSNEEWDHIAQFLKQNPVFDFSTLARTAIKDFVRNPKLIVTGIKEVDKPTTRRAKSSAMGGQNGRI